MKKEGSSDSNFTKNLLKGFKRYMMKKLKDSKVEADKF